MGNAIAQEVSFPPVSHRSGPISIPRQVRGDFWRTKWNWGTYSPSTSASPDNPHSSNRSTLLIMLGSCNRPTSGQSTKSIIPHTQKNLQIKVAVMTRLKSYFLFIYLELQESKSNQPWSSKTQSSNQISDGQMNLVSVFRHHAKKKMWER
jgi:hypothetical protein